MDSRLRIGVVGAHDEGPVFVNPFGGGRLEPRMVQRRLGSAMQDAAVPRIHPELRLPRSFHSLRYSTSVLMQHRGKHPRLIEQTLGHGSLEPTYGVYGGWTSSSTRRRSPAGSMPAAAFRSRSTIFPAAASSSAPVS